MSPFIPLAHRSVWQRSGIVVLVLLLSIVTIPNVQAGGESQEAKTRMCFFQPARAGTDGPNTMYGTFGADVIQALGGNDLIYGYPSGNYYDYSNDRLCGGEGSDWVEGGPGNDMVAGGPDNDSVYGNAGDDIVHGGLGSDAVFGGAGNDTLIDGNGNAP